MGKQHNRERALRRLTGEEIVEETKKHAVKAWGKILPFGAQVIASAAAYSVGLTATQLVGFVLKISCATPVLGPTMGLVGVGIANVLAGQASKHTRKMVVTRSHPLQPGFWEAPNPEDLVLDAVMGACIFKALGGRFSSVMPSDLTKPGALAFESIPVKANDPQAYAAPSVKRELARIYKRDGCHHCGTRKSPVIGDHMPPNAHVKVKGDSLGVWLTELPVVGKVAEVLGAGKGKRGPLQRFYPQCQPCSIKQATAVRTGKRVLVLHLHWPRRGRGEQLAGVFVGLRYNAPDMNGSSGAAGRRSGKWASLTLASATPMDGARIVDIRSPLADASGLALQHLGPELSSNGTSRGWSSSNTISTAPYMQVTPLLEGLTGTHLGTAAWQQQEQQQQQPSHSSSPRGYLASSNGGNGAYASGVVSYGSKGAQEGGKMNSSSAKGGAGSAHSMQQWHRGPSGPGDERLPDQNAVGQAAGRLGQISKASEVQGGLMVSLEGWAAAPAPPRQRGNPADVAMAPEHAKARAEAVFERHFAPGATY